MELDGKSFKKIIIIRLLPINDSRGVVGSETLRGSCHYISEDNMGRRRNTSILRVWNAICKFGRIYYKIIT